MPMRRSILIGEGSISLDSLWRKTHHLLEEAMALFQVLVCILCVFIDVLQLP
jgi:hypothetical protein